MPDGPKYPRIHVKGVGEDGNAHAIMGRVVAAMKEHGLDKAERDAFMAEAMSGDYDNLLNVCMNWVDFR